MFRNIPSDHEILAAVNERARLFVNAEFIPDSQIQSPLPIGYRCDMSRIGFIRRRWERARDMHLQETGLDVLESLRRIEAALRDPINAPVLYVERR